MQERCFLTVDAMATFYSIGALLIRLSAAMIPASSGQATALMASAAWACLAADKTFPSARRQKARPPLKGVEAPLGLLGAVRHLPSDRNCTPGWRGVPRGLERKAGPRPPGAVPVVVRGACKAIPLPASIAARNAVPAELVLTGDTRRVRSLLPAGGTREPAGQQSLG